MVELGIKGKQDTTVTTANVATNVGSGKVQVFATPMEPKNILNISSREELRSWYLDNHDTCREFWIRVNRGKTDVPGVIPYLDSVLEALCFGWIDSTLKKVDDGSPFQRYSPRRKGSHWTELNRERCWELERLGLMTPAGRKAYEDGL